MYIFLHRKNRRSEKSSKVRLEMAGESTHFSKYSPSLFFAIVDDIPIFAGLDTFNFNFQKHSQTTNSLLY